MSITLTAALRLGATLATAVAAVILARYFIAPGVDLDAMSRGLAGPATWPKTMLYSVVACAVFIFLRELHTLRAAVEPAAPGAPVEPRFDDAKLMMGIALLVAYGVGITLAGIAWSTLAFIAGWLVLSGLRRLRAVVLVSVIGTAAILYLFVKVSLMPLDRGKGVFEQATVFLYQLLGIY